MTCELIIGGARSGKSRLAQQRAEQDGREVVVIATAEPLDAEMAERISRHQRDRPAHWRTVEAPRELAPTLVTEAREQRVLVVDCLSLWLSNLMPAPDRMPVSLAAAPALHREREALLEVLPGLPGRVLLVANEVGLGLVPETALGRLFRDEAGWLNQAVAQISGRVTLVAAGLSLELKPA